MYPIDWQTGRWAGGKAVESVADITIAGDWAPIRDFSETILTHPEAVYGDLLPILRNSHLRLANLECPLVEGGTPVPKSGTELKGVPGHIKGLTAVPFEVVTLANNHVFDYGVKGFTDTRNLLDQNGILSTGAGLSTAEAEKPLIVTVQGIRVGIISFSEGEDGTAAGQARPGVFGWQTDRVIGHIKKLRSEVQVIIAICHGGVEYIPFPPPYLVDTFRRVAEAGADLVIGHHPHVPQGMEIHQGVPICYSLGNFVFFQPTDRLYRKIGYLVQVGVNSEGVGRIRLIPYEIGPRRLMRLTGKNHRRFLKKMADLSKPLERAEGATEAWHGFLKYYGIEGFKDEMGKILNQLEKEQPKGAAMFRNRLTTPQHYHHLTDVMTRIMDGSLDQAPAWAFDCVADFFTRRVVDGFPE